jgi:hypothetical protein
MGLWRLKRCWLQAAETRLCRFRPTFIAALEHSDEDLQAFLDELHEESEGSVNLKASDFRANTSKQPPAGATAAKSVKTPIDYAALYPPGIKERVDKLFAPDFDAFGYARDLSCI